MKSQLFQLLIYANLSFLLKMFNPNFSSTWKTIAGSPTTLYQKLKKLEI